MLFFLGLTAITMATFTGFLVAFAFIGLLCPEDAWNVRIKFRAGDRDLTTSIVNDAPVGGPVDKLVTTVRDWDAYEVTKENPVIRPIVCADLMQCIGVRCE